MSKKRKIRVDLRKNRYTPPREQDLTRKYRTQDADQEDTTPRGERVRARGDLSRRRTIIAAETTPSTETEGAASTEMPAVDVSECLPGRVLRVHGLQSVVAADDGRLFRCVVRRLLRSLVIDERSIVAPGDRVWFRPAGSEEGVIERVEPRHGLLTRASRGKEHVIVSNVDQLVVVASLAEPDLKPHLIDRYLVSAAHGRIQPVVCLNKVDLVDPADFQTVLGLYTQLGIPIVLTSAATGQGIPRLRDLLRDRQTVFAGQSGVGKSSLLNAIQPGLDLKVSEVSGATDKGKHTTSATELIKLGFGGWVVDTPGVRQFALWDIIPEELEGFFGEFHPYVPLCRFPDCTHQHEEGCAIRKAVRFHQIAVHRYESYLGMFSGDALD